MTSFRLAEQSAIGSKLRGMWLDLPFFWRFQLVGWTTYVLLSFPFKLVFFGSAGTALFVTATRDVLVFALTCVMRDIYRRRCNDVQRILRNIFVSLAISSAAGIILTGFSFILYEQFGIKEEVSRILETGIQIFYIHAGLCFGWSLLYLGIKSMIAMGKNEVLLANSIAKQREAELQALKSQINSHFLFNALNTIWAELDRKQQVLRQLVQALAHFLRYSLTYRHEEKSPLGAEFDAMVDYLTVEQARFRAKLDVHCGIDTAARTFLAPSVILQPLVENAIKYGRMTNQSVLFVRIDVQTLNPGAVQIEVANTGRWVHSTPSSHELRGLGLDNLKRRLELLYPGLHEFEVLAEYGWVTVRLKLQSPQRS